MTLKGKPLVISASRRTDLPGYHASECACLIRKKVKNLRIRYLYGVVFWSRYLKPFLKGGPLFNLVNREIENPFIHLTVTGQGATSLEPNAPSTQAVKDDIKDLVKTFKMEPWRIRWRFDPLLKGYTTIDDFVKIGTWMSDLGITTCTFSFPSYFSLKGDLTSQFEAHAIPKWTSAEKEVFLEELIEKADEMSIELFSCCQPENTRHGYVKESACIDKGLLERGHPERLPLLLDKDPSQRRRCNCIKSDDIGDYQRHLCKGGCVYCYSKAGGPGAACAPRA